MRIKASLNMAQIATLVPVIKTMAENINKNWITDHSTSVKVMIRLPQFGSVNHYAAALCIPFMGT
jgi:hypothetical protein